MRYTIPPTVFSEITKIIRVEDLAKKLDVTRKAIYNYRYHGCPLDNAFYISHLTSIPVERLVPEWDKTKPRSKQ